MAGRPRRPEKVWKVVYGDDVLHMDDLIFDELESLEKVTGQPWSTQNPLRSAVVAKAWLMLLFVRAGKTDEEALDAVGALTVRQFKNCFRLEDDDRPTYYGDDGLPVNHPNSAPETSTTS